MPRYISFAYRGKKPTRYGYHLKRNNPDQENSPHENKYHIETINMDVVFTHVLRVIVVGWL